MEAKALNEWLKLMLDEIRRKQREREEAARERARRDSGPAVPRDAPRQGPPDGLPGRH